MTDTKTIIDPIRLYEIMDCTIPMSSASGQHLPEPRSHWLSQATVYRWSQPDMVGVLSHLGFETTADEVPSLLEEVVQDGILRKTFDDSRNQLFYGVTNKGLAAWYAAEQMKDATAHHALTGE